MTLGKINAKEAATDMITLMAGAGITRMEAWKPIGDESETVAKCCSDSEACSWYYVRVHDQHTFRRTLENVVRYVLCAPLVIRMSWRCWGAGLSSAESLGG